MRCGLYSWRHSDSSRRAMSQDTAYIFDATTATFDQMVIDKSFDQPVLVDFWAEWCAPCKVLMPLLQQITESYQGELLLAKVNCDAEPDVVARFGIRSLPTVVLFKDGQPVDGFAGAQPESEI
ncbi:Thioredoxin, partial [Pseudomonas coronafaciens pv. atropurpurea]